MPSASTPTPKSVARVLAVEDHLEVGCLIEAMLARLRIETIVVHTGEAALLWLAKNSCDLILLDISLPGMNGLEVCRQLKASPQWRRLPVIFVSGHASPAYREEARRLGARDFIEKPFDLIPFLACVQKHLKLKPPVVKAPKDARSVQKK